MWIKTTHPFWDVQNRGDEPVPADKSMNVTAERGEELVGLGLAIATTDLPDHAEPPVEAPLEPVETTSSAA